MISVHDTPLNSCNAMQKCFCVITKSKSQHRCVQRNPVLATTHRDNRHCLSLARSSTDVPINISIRQVKARLQLLSYSKHYANCISMHGDMVDFLLRCFLILGIIDFFDFLSIMCIKRKKKKKKKGENIVRMMKEIFCS